MRQELVSKEGREIRKMFGRIAQRYDLLNRVLSVGRDVAWRRALAGRLAATDAKLVLDVCTGTGDVALAIDGPQVIGADFCLPMLELAQVKATTADRRLPLLAADALRLPLGSATVDAVTVAFGVRNFSNLDTGLAELSRVLRPRGTLLVLEFSHPRGVLAPLLGWWVRVVPPQVARWLSGDPEAYSYLPASVSTFPESGAMCRRLENAGLERVSARSLTGGVATLYEGVRLEATDER